MSIVRAIAGVLVGYLVYAVASMLLVGALTEPRGGWFIVGCLVGLAVIGFVAGALAKAVAGAKARLAVSIAAGLVALATLANILLQLGVEPTWYKLGTFLLTVPAMLVSVFPLRTGGR